MGIVTRRIMINLPTEKVYEYCRNPMTWAEWCTNLAGPNKLTGDGRVGTLAEMRFTMLSVQIPITIEVMEDTVDFRRLILRGAITGGQIVDFVPEGDATEVNIELTYSIPGSVLRKIADAKIIEKLVESTLAHSLENLKTICEGTL